MLQPRICLSRACSRSDRSFGSAPSTHRMRLDRPGPAADRSQPRRQHRYRDRRSAVELHQPTHLDRRSSETLRSTPSRRGPKPRHHGIGLNLVWNKPNSAARTPTVGHPAVGAPNSDTYGPLRILFERDTIWIRPLRMAQQMAVPDHRGGPRAPGESGVSVLISALTAQHLLAGGHVPLHLLPNNSQVSNTRHLQKRTMSNHGRVPHYASHALTTTSSRCCRSLPSGCYIAADGRR